MDFTEGYPLSESWLQRLTILDWLYDQAEGKPMVDVRYGQLAEQEPSYGVETLAGYLTDFENRGWVRPLRVLGFSGTSCSLTQRGIDFIDELRSRRGDIVGRRRAARDAVLRWLYDSNARGDSHPIISWIHQTGYGYYYGLGFSQQEIEDATRWLAEKGFLRGQGSWGGGIPRPSITAAGEDVVESKRSVNDVSPSLPGDDVPSPSTVTNYNITGGNINIADHSPGAQQSISISTETRQQVLGVAQALDDARGILGLDSAQTQVAAQVSADLRAEASAPQPDRGRLRELLAKVSEVAVSGTGTAIGSAVVALAEQAIAAIG
ncbi:hypothetical protein FHN55_05030 [Streptomyces sp. NP160]|uniref:hypothetical protein n=1 Tax=Streptomyces sp. NP160 TaxID=2586637 RepID=UPI001117CBF1|nr:hypothetical protein [Streptomyces sp. NP160]TNM69149.1 hypothetical protein FHN55_05030 [Streptomyces sp. NP160]